MTNFESLEIGDYFLHFPMLRAEESALERYLNKSNEPSDEHDMLDLIKRMCVHKKISDFNYKTTLCSKLCRDYHKIHLNDKVIPLYCYTDIYWI